MTIKTQNGKVITKDGKVSCACCDGPECCMYPAQALGDGDYSYDDLPDVIEVLIDNVFTPFSRSGIYFYSDSAIGLIPAGDYRVRLLDNGVPWIPGTEDFQYNWRLEVWNGISWGTRDDIDDWQCLIQGLPEDFERTHDQFADTYTVAWNFIGADVPPAAVVVTRESLCVWRGTDPCGKVIFLYYGDSVEIGGGLDFTWNLRLNNYVDGCGNPDFRNYIINKDRDAPSFQNSPVGYYPEIFATDATVS